MEYNNLKNIISIPSDEKEEFKSLIRSYRAKYISTPSEIVEKIFQDNAELLKGVVKHQRVTETISSLREQTYAYFLVEESDFNVRVLKHITDALKTPSEIFSLIANEKLDFTCDKDQVLEQIKELCGEYSGRISPYIYELCLSNTQSRRSRAGKTFEAIIYKLYEAFGFVYTSQKMVGKSTFEGQGLGKMVDSLLPSIECFKQRRDKVIIGTMKTTLRERWQEVIEEIQRTGLPSIHLLTMDDDISENKAIQMGKHNVIIVVPDYVKSTKQLIEKRNIVSFETYFLQEIPDMMKYWEATPY